MSADNDRTSGGEGAGGVPSGDRKREGEVGGAEDGDRTERAAHGSKVRLGDGGAIGLSVFDTGIDPGAFLDQVGKHVELTHGAAALAFAARLGESGLGHHTRGDVGTGGVYFLCNGAEEFGAGFRLDLGISLEGDRGKGDRFFKVVGGG